MFTGMRAENRSSSEALDAAALRQQRRLKQAIQFLHRDSADLLPLDGLKKLGTSKQGVSLLSKALSYMEHCTLQYSSHLTEWLIFYSLGVSRAPTPALNVILIMVNCVMV
uniref:Uncharacterized protein n=1 Tax=Fundulus heteroclitus TaxID=8078 RepID=A0A3Q2TP47_FUNHE